MKQIRALPKMIFDEHFNDELFKYYSFGAFISILDCDSTETKYNTAIENFLQVKMWDIEEDIVEKGKLQYLKPSDSELKRIVYFINQHKDKSAFIIHCSAGISRSGAVATFLYDKFLMEVDKEVFRRENKFISPNLYILHRLKVLDSKECINNPA
ncbi:protein-tyrosine phosphatase family protein [Flavobacterium antarcticum]|uniref:protein-tyrosine phosphatase family protein n=1 Tax=Flavobacterium antarcticum TaxID=271155 RepID=UPI0003B3C04A|nr:protein-tyrosine phosphatase family protein [Flavobacterium antarcticum]